MRSLSRVWSSTVTVLAVVGLVGLAVPASADATVVRAGPGSGAKGNGDSPESAVSAGGRYVAFSSYASNLDPADPDNARDVFVRDTATNTTTLVSRATGAAGVKSNGPSNHPVISADGRFVAFQSRATNLDPADTDGHYSVFVRDLTAETTTLVSRDDGAAHDSYEPAISGDGRHVAYTTVMSSVAAAPDGTTQPVPDDGGRIPGVYVRDLGAGTTALVSRASGATGAPADARAARPAISDDGRYVAFSSGASNLDDAATYGGVYVRDIRTDTTALVSRASGPNGAPGGGYADGISGDGRYVVFSSQDPLGTTDPGTAGYVLVRDRQTDTTTLVSKPLATERAGQPSFLYNLAYDGAISADGRAIAYTIDRGVADFVVEDPTRGQEVDLFDTGVGTTTLISRADGAQGAMAQGGSLAPAISPGGRFVTFTSKATTLDPADTDPVQDVFVRDRLRNTTRLVSRATGPPLPGPVFPAKLSVARARVLRSARTLDVLAPITARASGRVQVEFRAAGRTTRFTVPVDTGNRRVRFTRRIPAVQAALGTGILTLTYPGDPDTQPQTVRLRAAAGHAGLRAGRPRIVAGRLIAGGTVTPRARGVVRVQLVYGLVNPATTRTVQFTAPISGGRYRLDTQLSDTVATEISERAGTVHSYVLFTGYLQRRIRGELRSYQVLGAR